MPLPHTSISSSLVRSQGVEVQRLVTMTDRAVPSFSDQLRRLATLQREHCNVAREVKRTAQQVAAACALAERLEHRLESVASCERRRLRSSDGVAQHGGSPTLLPPDDERSAAAALEAFYAEGEREQEAV